MINDDDKIEAIELLSSIHELLYETRVKSRRLRNILVGNPVLEGRDTDMDAAIMADVASSLDELSGKTESAETNRTNVKSSMYDGKIDSNDLNHMDADLKGMEEQLPGIREDLEELF